MSREPVSREPGRPGPGDPGPGESREADPVPGESRDSEPDPGESPDAAGPGEGRRDDLDPRLERMRWRRRLRRGKERRGTPPEGPSSPRWRRRWGRRKRKRRGDARGAGRRPGERVPDNWAARHPVLAVAAALLALFLVTTTVVYLGAPDGSEYRTEWPERTAYMELRIEQAREEGRRLELRYRPVPLSRVPRHVQRAVLAAEDAAFWSHGGFDWEQIRYAIRKAWEEKSISRGASTITQQLARNLYLSPSRSPLRKLREAVIAFRLERTLPKARILELYLSVAEFGRGIFGVEAASRHYFGKSVSELGRLEAAQLAATLPWPLRNNPATNTGRFQWRTNLIHRLAFGSEEERIDITPPPLGEIEVTDPWARPVLADTVLADTVAGRPLFEPAPADTSAIDTIAPEGAPADTTATDAAPADTTAEAGAPPP